MFANKILCIGNNTEHTDHLTQSLADANDTKNYGLITDKNFNPDKYGYYHSTIIDLTIGEVIALSKNFDKIIMLDQPLETWDHWKPLLSTYRLMRQLEEAGHITEYRQNKNIQNYLEFDNLLEHNKSFCIYPWIEKIEYGGELKPCNRSHYVITTLDKMGTWQTDAEYQKLRTAMLKGERIPEVCSLCYEHEDLGIESYRTFDTRDWVSKLNIKSIDELNNITYPYLYEVRLNNKCNLACRGCRPALSSRIKQEYKKHNIIYAEPDSGEYSSLDIIDIDTLGPNVRVYLTGGEPTIIKEVHDFMEECIRRGKTDFDFTLGTNGAKLSKKFLELADHFTGLHFSMSIDGYGKINDYWRWGSEWNKLIANTKELQKRGHMISINCVPGIYNVTNLHLLFEFLDREFPFVGCYLQINYNDMQSAYNHPNSKLVIESMERCRKTHTYYTDGKSVRTTIDSLYNHYINNPKCDLEKLKQFFNYNDQQDRARNIKLIDYIPELEECRKYIL